MNVFFMLVLTQWWSAEYEPLPPRPIEIYVNDSEESKILKSELTRSWYDYRNVDRDAPASAIIAEMEAKRQRILSRCKISQIPFELRDKACPCYRWGSYGTFTKFDSRTFCGSGTCLLSLDILMHNQDANVDEWEKDCADRLYSYRLNYFYAVHTFLIDKNLTDGEDYYNRVYQDFDDGVKWVQETYSKVEGIPKYDPPEMPRSPLWREVWLWEFWGDY